jgi:predicted sulfurtransferase
MSKRYNNIIVCEKCKKEIINDNFSICDSCEAEICTNCLTDYNECPVCRGVHTYED